MTINLERAALEGRLKGAEEELRRLEVRADALISDVRAKLDPYADSIVDLEIEDALVLVQELNKTKERAAALKKKIKEYRGALYG